VESGGAHAKRAQVVSDHRLISQALGNIALYPKPRCIRRAKELVGDHSAIDSEPEREVAFRAAHAWKRSDSTRQCQVLVKRVAYISSNDYLRSLALRWV